MVDSTQILNELLDTLDAKIEQAQGGQHGDAIAKVLSESPRTTAVVSLHDAPAVEAFRQALMDGLIRVDTANKLLELVNAVVTRLLP